jgi:hypothetical protein
MGLVMSANDAFMILAMNQGEGIFVGWMDQKSKEIGLKNTGFFDPLFLTLKVILLLLLTYLSYRAIFIIALRR